MNQDVPFFSSRFPSIYGWIGTQPKTRSLNKQQIFGILMNNMNNAAAVGSLFLARVRRRARVPQDPFKSQTRKMIASKVAAIFPRLIVSSPFPLPLPRPSLP